MKIGHLRVSHLEKPLGFWLEKPEVSWIVEESTGKKQESARIEVSLDEEFGTLVYDSKRREDISSLSAPLEFECMPRTRYYLRVTVWADDGDTCTSPATWFETGKMSEEWEAKWIQAPFDKEVHPLFQRTFHIPGSLHAPMHQDLGYMSFISTGRKRAMSIWRLSTMIITCGCSIRHMISPDF